MSAVTLISRLQINRIKVQLRGLTNGLVTLRSNWQPSVCWVCLRKVSLFLIKRTVEHRLGRSRADVGVDRVLVLVHVHVEVKIDVDIHRLDTKALA